MPKNKRSLKVNEKKVLELLLDNKDYSFKEIAKIVDLNEVSVRRIHNRLRSDGVFSNMNIPNFPLLGFRIMIVQNIQISSNHLIGSKKLMCNIFDEWDNCIDCNETYDGKIIVRSVWKDADAFKNAHSDFLKKHGTDWFDSENIDMIPLDQDSQFINIKNIS